MNQMMNKFFYPKSMVVVGVSLRRQNLGQIILLNNRENNYQGKLYAIGNEAGDLGGIPVYRRIADLPEIPDVAVIITPAQEIPGLLTACGEKGISHVVIESGGFSEFSHRDHSLEEEVLSIAEDYGIRFIGPNCIGTINFDINMMMPFAFFKDTYPGGRVGIIVQSGGMGGVYRSALLDQGIRPGKFVSIGNKLQIDETDCLKYFMEDDKTDLIVLYLEDFRRGRAFYDLAGQSPKPIIIHKANRSEASARIARSHTAAISTSDDVITGFCRQAAIIRVNDELELINAVKIARLPLLKGRRLAVLSRSGGHAVVTADACARYGLTLIDFPARFLSALKKIYHTRVIAHQNPLDLGEIFDYTIFTRILEEALKLNTVDGVIFNHLYSAAFESEMSRDFLKSVGGLARKYEKPVAVVFVSDAQEILEVSRSQDYPLFSSPEMAAQALHVSASYFERKTARDAKGQLEDYQIDLTHVSNIKESCRRRSPLLSEALQICQALGFPTAPYATIGPDNNDFAINLKYPLAVKLISPDASHKTEVGGIKLGLRNRREVLRSMEDIKAAACHHGSRVSGFLLQEMVTNAEEFFIGGRRDPVFGPIVMVGLGGIFVELFQDTATCLAPVTLAEARDMLSRLRAYPLLNGIRGRSPLDASALADVIRRVSWLIAQEEDIEEIDLNPVFVRPRGQGVSLVDARIFYRSGRTN